MLVFCSLFSMLRLLVHGDAHATSPLYSPLQGKEYLVLSGEDLLAWDRRLSHWSSIGEGNSDALHIPDSDLAAEFWVRFRPSHDTSEYGEFPISFFPLCAKKRRRKGEEKTRGHSMQMGDSLQYR